MPEHGYVEVYGDIISLEPTSDSKLVILYTACGKIVDISIFDREWLDRAEYEADA